MPNIPEKSLKYLQELHEKFPLQPVSFNYHKEWVPMPSSQRKMYTLIMRYLKDHGMITVLFVAQGCPFNIEITSYGYDVLNQLQNPQTPDHQPSSVTIHVAENNGVVASHAQNFTINNSITWEALREEVKNRNLPVEEEQQISEVITKIQTQLKSGKPIESGSFSTISTLLVRHSWLTNAVASALLNYVLK